MDDVGYEAASDDVLTTLPPSEQPNDVICITQVGVFDKQLCRHTRTSSISEISSARASGSASRSLSMPAMYATSSGACNGEVALRVRVRVMSARDIIPRRLTLPPPQERMEVKNEEGDGLSACMWVHTSLATDPHSSARIATASPSPILPGGHLVTSHNCLEFKRERVKSY